MYKINILIIDVKNDFVEKTNNICEIYILPDRIMEISSQNPIIAAPAYPANPIMGILYTLGPILAFITTEEPIIIDDTIIPNTILLAIRFKSLKPSPRLVCSICIFKFPDNALFIRYKSLTGIFAPYYISHPSALKDPVYNPYSPSYGVSYKKLLYPLYLYPVTVFLLYPLLS